VRGATAIVIRAFWKDALVAAMLAAALAGYWTLKIGVYDDALVAVSSTGPPFVSPYPDQPFGVSSGCGPVSSLLYPPRIVHLVLPAHVAMHTLIAVHLCAAGLFMYIFLRTLGTGRVPAFCGGATFMFSGTVLSSSIEPSALFTLCYAPLMLALVHKTLTRPGLHWPVLTGLAGTLELTAGFPQIALYTVYCVCVYAAVELVAEYVIDRRWRQMWPVVGKLCTAAAVTASLAAPQLWLWARWRVVNGATAAAIDRAMASTARDHVPLGTMFEAALNPGPLFGLRYQYMGLGAIVLAVAAMLSRQRMRRVLAIAGIGAAGLLISAGTHSWLYRLYVRLPTGEWFGDPHRSLVLWTVSIAALCGLGLDYFERTKREPWSHGRRIEVAVVCAAGLVLALFVKPLGQMYILGLIFCICTVFTVSNRALWLAAEICAVAIVLFDPIHAAAFRGQVTGAEPVEMNVQDSARSRLPRAYIVTRYEVIENVQDVLERVRADDFDPRTAVILDRPPDVEPEKELSEPVAAAIEDVTFGHTTVTTPELAGPGILVLTDTAYPGSHTVFVDGDVHPLLHANHVYRAVSLGPGTHTVRFEYRLPGWYTGRWISFIALAILVAVGIVELARSTHPTKTGDSLEPAQAAS